MRIADWRNTLFVGKRSVEMHRSATGYQEDVPDARVGDKLKDIIGEFHQFL